MFKRIAIFGRPGSGKSTFAFALHKKTEIPVLHLDKIFFTHNWAKANYEEFLEKQNSVIKQEQWIIDGCSLKSLHLRYERADIVLFFNYPRVLCFWRLIKRMWIKNPAIDDRAPGCKESISWNLIKYTWTFEYREDNKLKHLLAELRAQYPHVKFIEITNDRELKEVYGLFNLEYNK